VISIIFDTETTGLPKHPNAKDGVQPRIIEFAAALVDRDGEVLDTIDRLINPGIPLEAIITKITGLTDESLAEEPPFLAVLPDIAAFFRAADQMIAHNLPFDSTLLQLELARNAVSEFPWPRAALCTVQEHAEEWGRRPKLKELYEHYMGAPLDQKHRALDDVMALVDVCRAAEVLGEP